MDSFVVQIVLCVVAAWAWVQLVRVSRRDLPAAIYLQQNLGLSTPWPFYRLARLWRWLAASGAVAGVVVLLVPVARAGLAVGVLAVAVGLLTYIHGKMARLLDPRVVNSVVQTLRGPRSGSGPDEPAPVA